MKKRILLLILVIIVSVIKIDVYATTYTDKFYISEVIEGIFYAKEKDGKVEYRKAKFKRRHDDNKIVYCIEPFVNMTENDVYKGYDENYESLLNLSEEDWKKINLLSYYGYGYKNHTDEKWYPITQLLIWEVIDKNANFYYTDTYKGTKINQFTNEIEELKKLVENHDKLPSFSNSLIKMSIDSSFILNDENKVLNTYEIINNGNLIIEKNDNQIVINSDKDEKEIEIILSKKDNLYKTPPIVYVSEVNQNILIVGEYKTINTSFKVQISSGSLKITKYDLDTNTTTAQGEAQLIGTIYELYDGNNNYIDEIVIGENNQGIINNLKYGDYKLIEKSAGIGYKLDLKNYYFNINSENKIIELNLKNEVIKSKIKIKKYIKTEELENSEKNIKFQILNNNEEIYKEVITDDNGYVEFELPYGKYLVKQINTTEGYNKVDDFFIEINENSKKELEYFLYDLKNPDTYQNENNKTILIAIFTIFITISILKQYAK